jgi:titin
LDGVAIHGTSTMSNTVSGNYIGTTADGLDGCANTLHGVYVYGGAQNNTIGRRTAGEGNVISGNGKDGIRIYGSNTAGNDVAGNYIGTDASGLAALPNGESGIAIRNNARNSLIGGDDEPRRNVISGNTSHGMHIDNAHHIEVVGNFVGLGAGGLTAVANGGAGIMLSGGARDNTIGGIVTYYEPNVISANDTGIWIEGTGTRANRVRGNGIGIAMNADPLGNTYDGVHLSFGAQDNTIGPDNFILYNGNDGVGVDTPLALGNTITENFIFANGGMGIHLTNGAHNGIAAPVITSASGEPGGITGTACPGCTVEVFVNPDTDGEGFGHVGSAVADGGGSFAVTASYLIYPYRCLTATATDAADGTSEFSGVFIADIPILFLPLMLQDY